MTPTEALTRTMSVSDSLRETHNGYITHGKIIVKETYAERILNVLQAEPDRQFRAKEIAKFLGIKESITRSELNRLAKKNNSHVGTDRKGLFWYQIGSVNNPLPNPEREGIHRIALQHPITKIGVWVPETETWKTVDAVTLEDIDEGDNETVRLPKGYRIDSAEWVTVLQGTKWEFKFRRTGQYFQLDSHNTDRPFSPPELFLVLEIIQTERGWDLDKWGYQYSPDFNVDYPPGTTGEYFQVEDDIGGLKRSYQHKDVDGLRFDRRECQPPGWAGITLGASKSWLKGGPDRTEELRLINAGHELMCMFGKAQGEIQLCINSLGKAKDGVLTLKHDIKDWVIAGISKALKPMDSRLDRIEKDQELIIKKLESLTQQ
jgi:hypothetical protein